MPELCLLCWHSRVEPGLEGPPGSAAWPCSVFLPLVTTSLSLLRKLVAGPDLGLTTPHHSSDEKQEIPVNISGLPHLGACPYQATLLCIYPGSLAARAPPLADAVQNSIPAPITFLHAFFSLLLQSRLNISSKPHPRTLACAYFSAWDVLPFVSLPFVSQLPQLSVPLVGVFLIGCEKCHSQSPSLPSSLLSFLHVSRNDMYIYHIKMSASWGQGIWFLPLKVPVSKIAWPLIVNAQWTYVEYMTD